jgi:hypothetical protein
MLERWKTGEICDVHAEMMALTLGIAAKTLFDAEVKEDVETIDQATNALAAEIANRFGRPIVIPDAVPLPGHIRYRRALRKIEGLVTRMIAEPRVHPGDRSDLLSILLEARDDAGQPPCDSTLRAIGLYSGADEQDRFNLHCHAVGEGTHTHGRTGMTSVLSQHLDEEIGTAVNHLGMVGKLRLSIDHT